MSRSWSASENKSACLRGTHFFPILCGHGDSLASNLRNPESTVGSWAESGRTILRKPKFTEKTVNVCRLTKKWKRMLLKDWGMQRQCWVTQETCNFVVVHVSGNWEHMGTSSQGTWFSSIMKRNIFDFLTPKDIFCLWFSHYWSRYCISFQYKKQWSFIKHVSKDVRSIQAFNSSILNDEKKNVIMLFQRSVVINCQ